MSHMGSARLRGVCVGVRVCACVWWGMTYGVFADDGGATHVLIPFKGEQALFALRIERDRYNFRFVFKRHAVRDVEGWVAWAMQAITTKTRQEPAGRGTKQRGQHCPAACQAKRVWGEDMTAEKLPRRGKKSQQ
jgi:hypothetical protein